MYERGHIFIARVFDFFHYYYLYFDQFLKMS